MITLDTYNILQIINVRRRGGSGEAAARLCEGLHKHGHRVTVICPPALEWSVRLDKAGLRVITDFPIKFDFRPWTIACISRLRRLVLQESIDIVHVHRSTDHWAAAFALTAFRNRPALIRTRHIVTPIQRNLATRWLYGHATDQTIAVGGIIEQEIRRAGILTHGKLSLIPGAIELEKFRSPVRNLLRREIGASPDEALIGIVARLSEIKGHRHFLNAARKVADARTNDRFIIIGDGPLRGELEAQARSLRIENRVHFLGWRNDVESLLPDLDVYVLASIGSEGSSRATLEAMAAGLPVVATRVGVLPEVVEEGKTGLLVPPADADRLACAILEVLASPERREMGRRGQERVEKEFTIEQMISNTETVYSTALVERRSRRA